MSSVRILGNDETVVVLWGEKNLPESFDWLSVSTVSKQIRTAMVSQELFNRDGRRIARRMSEGRSRFRSCVLPHLAVSQTASLFAFFQLLRNAPCTSTSSINQVRQKFFAARDSVSKERPCFSVASYTVSV